MTRLLLVLALGATGCAPPDLFIGTFSYSITAGLDTTTAPTNSTSTPSGTGSLVITAGKTDAYLLTLAPSDTGGCTLKGTKKKDEQAMTFDLVANQPCVLKNASNQATASITSGTVTLAVTQVSQNEIRRDISLPVQYSYSGTGAFGINFAGTGNRTYAGTDL